MCDEWLKKTIKDEEHMVWKRASDKWDVPKKQTQPIGIVST